MPICPIIVSFSVSPNTLRVGNAATVQVRTNPAGSAVTYTSSNTAIAAVTSDSDASPPGSSGTLTCQTAGQTKLTVSTTGALPDGGSCPPNMMSALIDCQPTN
jgi:hypothetical protein